MTQTKLSQDVATKVSAYPRSHLATAAPPAAMCAHLAAIWQAPPRRAASEVLAEAKALLLRGRLEEGRSALREARWHGASRQEMITISLKAAAADKAFGALVGEGDRARDHRNWPTAERAYAAALRLYPLHGGYRVQHGHMLKEQSRFPEAEVEYRSALALGAEPERVDEHLDFVCRVQGVARGRVAAQAPAGSWLQAAPTGEDVATLGALIWHGAEPSVGEIASLLRSAATIEDVAALMLRDARVARSNGAFISLLSGRP